VTTDIYLLIYLHTLMSTVVNDLLEVTSNKYCTLTPLLQ